MKGKRLGTLLTLAIALAGCAGGGRSNNGAGAQDGQMTVNMMWPAGSGGPQSAVITVLEDGQVVAQRTIDRAQNSTLFDNLPVGDLDLNVTSYPNPDGTGTAEASATTSANVTAGGTALTFSTATPVQSIEVSDSQVQITSGDTATLSATATDAGGNIVLMPAGSVSWNSANPLVASVNSAGVVTGNLAGTTQITATESSSGDQATTDVDVDMGIAITPGGAILSPLGAQQFNATVTGATNQGVTWSVQESGGGTITPLGLYVAPAQEGTYTIVATSVEDPSQSTTATVQVE